MSSVTLSGSEINAIPVLGGEADLLKTIQLLPGVSKGVEGSTDIFVRGGAADQNLVLLDGAPVYNTGHLFGFLSVFNPDVLSSVESMNGAFPASYGGRLSSILDVHTRSAFSNRTQVKGNIGILASRLMVQQPLVKDKLSVSIAGRRTYVDQVVRLLGQQLPYHFYDLNAKVNYIFSEKDRLYLSGYFGRDVFDFENSKQSLKINIPWGNATGTLRWNHVYNQKLFGNTTLVYNDYNFTFNAAQNNFELKLASGIRDISLKQDFDLYPYTGHKLKFGGIYTYHKFTPSVVSGKQDSTVFKPNNAQIKYGHEAAVYLQDDWEVNEKLKVNAGIRYSWFQQIGPYKIYTTDDNGNRTDSTVFGSGKGVKNYGGLEPRLTIRYALNDETSLKASVTRNLQYIHLVSNAGTTLPTDIWVPSTYKVRPQVSWLYAAGLFKNFKDNMYETSVELYYKQMQNQIEYKEGYTPTSIDDTENSFVFGKGWSYGAEFFVNKTKGRLTGWLGYTLSWTWRQFPGLNFGNKYPAKYDRRNDMSIVAIYELNKKWRFSASFVFGTGNAATLPERFYIVDGILTQEYSKINEYRLPAYHRLDLAAIMTPKKNAKRKWKSEWVFSVYNAYSRKNPYFIYFDQTGSPFNGTLQIQAKQVSLFPIIPAITWNVRF